MNLFAPSSILRSAPRECAVASLAKAPIAVRVPRAQRAPAPASEPERIRPEIFTVEFVMADPEAAAEMLDRCYYDLVDSEKALLAERGKGRL